MLLMNQSGCMKSSKQPTNDMMTVLVITRSALLKRSSEVKPRMEKSPFCAVRWKRLRMLSSNLLE